MYYIYIDGDNVGLDIERSFIENDEESLSKINKEMNQITERMSSYLTSIGFTILFSGADGIICKGESSDIRTISSFIRSISNTFTFSSGIGSNLRDTFTALRYAKSIGKNVTVLLENHELEVVQDNKRS